MARTLEVAASKGASKWLAGRPKPSAISRSNLAGHRQTRVHQRVTALAMTYWQVAPLNSLATAHCQMHSNRCFLKHVTESAGAEEQLLARSEHVPHLSATLFMAW